ncbi:hypothetical protein Tco_0935650 [Tanacetum coccineum]
MNCTYGDGKSVTCCECEIPLNGGFCLICALRAGNSSACDPNPNSYMESHPELSDLHPQPIPVRDKDAPNEDEIFDLGDDIAEIDAFLDVDTSTDIEDGYHDSEGDIHYLESLLSDNTTLSLPSKVFLDHDPRSLSNDLKIMVKVFDPGIHEKKFSPTYESLTFEDRHYLSFTYVIRTFLPYFTYPVIYPFPLSSGSEDIIFDLGISAFHFSLEPVAFKCPIEVCSSTCFIPNFTMIWGESS